MQNDTFRPVESESVEVREPEQMQELLQKKDKKAIKIPIRTIIIIAIIIAIGVLLYIFKGLFVVATVDGSPISRLSIIQKLEKASGKSLLDSLITEKLIENEAKAKGISVSGQEVDAEIAKVSDQIKQQGGTIEEALNQQGMTMDDFKNRIVLQKKVEKLVAEKINVTDQEIEQYIKDSKVEIPKGQEDQIKNQIKETLRGQKINTEANSMIAALKAKAKINYFISY